MDELEFFGMYISPHLESMEPSHVAFEVIGPWHLMTTAGASKHYALVCLRPSHLALVKALSILASEQFLVLHTFKHLLLVRVAGRH